VFQKRSAGDVSSWTLKLKGMMWGQLLSAVDGSASSEQCQTPSVAECRNQAVSAVRARMSDGYLLVRESGPLKLAELLGQGVQVAHEHTERIGRGKHQKYSRQHHKANHPYASKTEEAQQIDRQVRMGETAGNRLEERGEHSCSVCAPSLTSSYASPPFSVPMLPRVADRRQ
jgi:hypothetical protein